ncbi:hypothetical protein E2C01_066340 [Portunus trituberculatus]|uniref:Uncharacterized protein n=1 Tax=Portunus trituberculatus TaxID=210409 RepID=A0A5B7HS27_PORTR|nr:hypothetical protein [Portunus trituberculatus]
MQEATSKGKSKKKHASTNTMESNKPMKKLKVLVEKKARKLRPIAPVGIREEYVWEALFSFRPLVAQVILFIVAPILGPISPPKRIFGVTT